MNAETNDLLFSAKYFDNLLSSRKENDHQRYLCILSAAAYYLCGFPGSSYVILRGIQSGDLDCNNLDTLITALITKRPNGELQDLGANPFGDKIRGYTEVLRNFISTGNSRESLLSTLSDLRRDVYGYGNDRELLFVDVLKALNEKYVNDSVWTALPTFSQLDVTLWDHVPFWQRLVTDQEVITFCRIGVG